MNKMKTVARPLRDLMAPYNHSSNVMKDRSFTALNDPSSTPDRLYYPYCAATDMELQLDELHYFTDPSNKATMEEEFLSDLRSAIYGIRPYAVDCYIDAIRAHQDSTLTPCLRMLQQGVRAYMQKGATAVTIEELLDEPEQACTFSSDDIARIIRLNQQLLEKHLHSWKEMRHHEISDGDIYLKRGISESFPLSESGYQERKWITSYTLALTVAESFANVGKLKHKNLIHLVYEDARSRVLFFMPFIPKTRPLELEFGLIPFALPRSLKRQQTEGEYDEYVVQPP